MSMPKTREDFIYFARLAEQGERYEDMIKYMKEVSRVSATHRFRLINLFILDRPRALQRGTQLVECRL